MSRKFGPRGPLVPLLVAVIIVLALLVCYLLQRDFGRVPVAPQPAAQAVSASPGAVRPESEQATSQPVQKAVSSAQGAAAARGAAAAPAPAPATRRPPPRRVPSSAPATVALVIDDMGADLAAARRLLGIGVPVTLSIIPGTAHDRATAALAAGQGYPVMIHMPMQPKGYPQQRLEANGLLLSMGGEEIVAAVEEYVARLPGAVGANNHMGSAFTESSVSMMPVLATLRKHQLFFLDSKTSGHSCGESLARSIGLPAAGRDVFLDNVQDEAAIGRQLAALVAVAAKRGVAVGICHPHRATLQVLTRELPALKAQGVRFVFATEVVD